MPFRIRYLASSRRSHTESQREARKIGIDRKDDNNLKRMIRILSRELFASYFAY